MSTNTKAILKVEKEGISQILTLEDWEKLTQTTFIHHLEFDPPSLYEKLRKKTEKLYKKGELTRQQLWFGNFFKTEIESPFIPDVILRYIDPVLGWGVFANRNFRKMEFIAEYSGVLRKSKRKDKTNAYCFDYTMTNGESTPYTIDAQDRGGISRFINHSQTPNLQSSLATIDFFSHVILITSRPIKRGEQLLYDYGPDYWSRRASQVIDI